MALRSWTVAVSSRLGRSLDRENCEIGADDLTEVAVNAEGLIHYFGEMIALCVERVRDAQNIARTVDYAELTSLTSVFDDYDLAFAPLDGRLIQWSSPVLHDYPLCRPFADIYAPPGAGFQQCAKSSGACEFGRRRESESDS